MANRVGQYITVALAGVLACACTEPADQGEGVGGAIGPAGSLSAIPGAAGDAGGRSGNVGSSGADSGDDQSEGCPLAPVPLRTTGTVLELSTELTLGGDPVEFGEPNPLPGGGTLLPLEFRFYISHVALLRADDTAVDVDIVTDAGAPVAYGVHLVNADHPESLRIRLLAPPGSYSGISFTLGLDDACNSGSQARHAPLSAASGMTWPDPFGYLFLRYAGTVMSAQGDAALPDAGADDSTPPGALHMGGLRRTLFAPRVEARASLTVDASAPGSARLAFSFDELFRGALTPLDLSDSPVPSFPPEVEAGERVRRLAPELELFTLLPP